MFDLTTLIGFAVAYVIIMALMYYFNKLEARYDVKIQEIEAAERKRQQEERARKRAGKPGHASAPAAHGAGDLLLATAAAAAVHQYRADHESK